MKSECEQQDRTFLMTGREVYKAPFSQPKMREGAVVQSWDVHVGWTEITVMSELRSMPWMEWLHTIGCVCKLIQGRLSKEGLPSRVVPQLIWKLWLFKVNTSQCSTWIWSSNGYSIFVNYLSLVYILTAENWQCIRALDKGNRNAPSAFK